MHWLIVVVDRRIGVRLSRFGRESPADLPHTPSHTDAMHAQKRKADFETGAERSLRACAGFRTPPAARPPVESPARMPGPLAEQYDEYIDKDDTIPADPAVAEAVAEPEALQSEPPQSRAEEEEAHEGVPAPHIEEKVQPEQNEKQNSEMLDSTVIEDDIPAAQPSPPKQSYAELIQAAATVKVEPTDCDKFMELIDLVSQKRPTVPTTSGGSTDHDDPMVKLAETGQFDLRSAIGLRFQREHSKHSAEGEADPDPIQGLTTR